MYETLPLRDLNRLQRLIAKSGVHNRPLEPIDPKPLLADVPVIRTVLPREINAFIEQWRVRRKRLQAVGYRSELDDFTESAALRHALAHEFGHIFFMHEGDIIYLYREGHVWKSWALDENVCGFDERQSEAVAAYVLLTPQSLMAYGAEGAEYLARAMDVPQRLVEMRWQIWSSHHR